MQSTRITIYGFYFAFWVLGISAILLGVNGENLTQQFNMPLEDSGVFISLQGLGSTITILFIGIAYNYYHPRFLLLSGPILLASGCGIIGLAESQIIAILGALLLGLGFGALLVGPNMIIPTLNKGKSTGALNALNMFFGIGAVAGPQIVNLAMRFDDYRLSFLFCGLCAFIVVIVFSFIQLPQTLNDGENQAPVGSLRTMWTNISWIIILPFSILLLLYVGTEVGFGAWLYTQMTRVAGATESDATLIVSLFWGGIVLGRLLASKFAESVNAEHLLLLTIATIGIATGILLAFSDSVIIGAVSAFIVGIGCGPVFPTTLAIVSDTYPRLFILSSGIIIAIGNLGAMIIPWAQGQVGRGENGGMIVPFILAGVMIIIAIYIQQQVYQKRQLTISS